MALLVSCVLDARVAELPGDPPPDAGTAHEPLASCLEPIECPAPAPGRATVCGQLHRVKSGAPLRAVEGAERVCDSGNPSMEGPCSVCVNAFSLAALAADPVAATPLDSAGVEVDECGRYRVVDVEPPLDQRVAIVAGSCGLVDRWIPTASPVQLTAGAAVEQRAAVTRAATDERWTETAGHPFGERSFADVGVYVVTFAHGGRAAPDVVVTVGGRPNPLATFYFDDDRAALRTLEPGRARTGLNGAALAVGAGVQTIGGTGGEPAGCTWPSEIAAGIPGVVVVAHKRAVCDW